MQAAGLRKKRCSLTLTRSDLRRAERHLHAGGDSI